jgi:hypothetical protein
MLEADWDLEGAPPIDRTALETAAQIVQLVESSAWRQGLNWQPPVVGPDPDGGIDLVWEGVSRRALLTARPQQDLTVECVTREGDAPPIRQTVSIADAVNQALWALDS